MLSEVMQRRLLGAARRWDSDGDGFVEKEDYSIATGRLAGLSGFAPGSPEYDQIHQAMMAGWDLLRTFDNDGDGRVSIEECLGGFEAMFADPERFQQLLVEPNKGIFDLIDVDRDGRISVDEHRAWLEAMNTSEAEIAVAFAHLDPNEDGYLSREEFVELHRQFFTEDDPEIPGAWLFGSP
ncbi:MAG TPA: EF-hand domain-containing protein [Acidimicrobiales bacterium]|nr:EF-hand domain-containing protein [Acidimicrobiales bacterium]